ncbi:hypothetical protein TEA_016108 [Camellia sinensis var. sinensis]|uniref:Dolichyl-diphosphooligosaccharide--protein glycosyltransferase subunit DAD1 n=1 Tax=Camellia sinensis var. sinensis TaxID=542762 RepID=A0A4S4ESR1_CAMSN|nr:hypothetical protein TEA_016108 [Camellia sinensis var. sinensis]
MRVGSNAVYWVVGSYDPTIRIAILTTLFPTPNCNTCPVMLALCFIRVNAVWYGPIISCLGLFIGYGLHRLWALFNHNSRPYSNPCHFRLVQLTALFKKVVYMAVVGSFPFNSFLSGVLSCVGTAVLAICLRIQVNKENKEFKDLPPERAFADFVLCNLVLHLVIMNFLG